VASPRRRLDVELVRRGLVETRQQAHRCIADGHVLVSGTVADKAGRLVAPGEPVEVVVPPRYVSRAGVKLEAALDHFGIDVAGRSAVDVGASTGGFTDCLLQRGAASVVALDVGRGQLHDRLRSDARVTVVERCNVRHLAPGAGDADRERLVGPPASLVVVDISFISLVVVADAVAGLLAGGGDLLVLVKPQFEAGRQVVSHGSGVVRDPDTWAEVLTRVLGAYADRGLQVAGVVESPIQGGHGNVEFMAHLRNPVVPGGQGERAALRRLVGAMVEGAVAGALDRFPLSRNSGSDQVRSTEEEEDSWQS
jgi:23S rRNA (cytidine1920-2'-O)/16S rRNA (cytidine1409-2'-O)-methyltransferase